jgi:hypothetical protein
MFVPRTTTCFKDVTYSNKTRIIIYHGMMFDVLHNILLALETRARSTLHSSIQDRFHESSGERCTARIQSSWMGTGDLEYGENCT